MEAPEKPPLCPYCKKHVEIKVDIREIEPFVPLYCKNCGVLLSIQVYDKYFKYLSTHLYPENVKFPKEKNAKKSPK